MVLEAGVDGEREVVGSSTSCLVWGSSIALGELEGVDLDVVGLAVECTVVFALPAASKGSAGLLDHRMNRSSADNEEIRTAAAGTGENVDAIKMNAR